MMRVLLVAGLLSIAVGCSNTDRPGFAPEVEGGVSGASGNGGSGGAAGTDGGVSGNNTGGTDGGVSTPASPVVMITSPEAVTDPDVGPVLSGTRVKVLCTVTPGTDPGSTLDNSTVSIELLDSQGTSVDHSPGVATANADEYSAEFVLNDVANGPVSFRCSAQDRSSPPLAGSAVISTFVDHGPAITVRNPLPDSTYPLKGSIVFDFSVDPAPLTAGDMGGDVDTVTLTVDGHDIPVVEDAQHPGLYQVGVSLTDPLFTPPPTGSVPVFVRATNQRGVTRIKSFNFAIDSVGPVITITQPGERTVVGGQVTLKFTVTDPSGVDTSRLSVFLNDTEFPYDAADPSWSGDDFTFRFDSTVAVTSIAIFTVNIIAYDLVGNVSQGQSLNLYLDNRPPDVDLDPQPVRETTDVGNTTYCSNRFDPVGVRAANDLSIVNNFVWFRALVWDRTNSLNSMDEKPDILHYSTTDPQSVYLYIQPDPSKALLVRDDHQPMQPCDDIDPTGTSFQHLVALDPTGGAYFGDGDLGVPVADPMACSFRGDDIAQAPLTLCSQHVSDLARVIQHSMAGVQPVIYAVAPAGSGSKDSSVLECTGGEWEVGALKELQGYEGWICAAVLGADRVGNVGVSRPLRLCYDDLRTAAQPACATSSDPPPSCTDGCIPAPQWAGRILTPHAN